MKYLMRFLKYVFYFKRWEFFLKGFLVNIYIYVYEKKKNFHKQNFLSLNVDAILIKFGISI